jgi:hypothetical protein
MRILIGQLVCVYHVPIRVIYRPDPEVCYPTRKGFRLRLHLPDAQH